MVLAALAGLVLVWLLWTCIQELQGARQQAHSRVKVQASLAADGLHRQLSESYPLLKRIAVDCVERRAERMSERRAERGAGQAVAPASCEGFDFDFAHLNKALVNIALRDLRGDLICERSRPIDVAPLRSGQIGGAPKPAASAGSGLFGEANGLWLARLTQTLFDSKGTRLATLSLQFDLVTLSQGLRGLVAPGTLVEVLSKQQTIIARTAEAAAFIGRRELGDYPHRPLREGFLSLQFEGEAGPRLNYLIHVPGTDWRLFAGQLEANLFADYERLLLRSMGLALAFVLVLTFLCWRVGIARLSARAAASAALSCAH